MTYFDVITVACFGGLVVVFFTLTDQHPRLLLRFLVTGIVLATANYFGNHGYALFAASLVAAAIAFTAMSFIDNISR